MTQSERIVELVNQMPKLDELGKVTGPEWEVAEAIIGQVFDGGEQRIHEVIDLLEPPGGEDDCKPRYLLHAMAVQVARPGGRKWRDAYCHALASRLGSDLPKPVQAFLIGQLQVAGAGAVVGQLGAQLLDEELCEYATQALLAIRVGAAEQLRRALPEAKGPILLTLVHALGVLRDEASGVPLRRLANHGDPQIESAAIQALARIGDSASVDVLLQKADEAKGFHRIAATDACLTLAGRLAENEFRNEALKIYTHLRDTRRDTSEDHVASAAEKAMAEVG